MSHISLGLMSGTSADGVSAVAASFKGHQFELLASTTESYPSSVADRVRMGSSLSAADVSELNVELGHLFAKAANHVLKKANLSPKKVVCIGSHGQTIYHGPEDNHPNSFQIADPALIAEKTGIPVVSHFRQADLAVGGQGAPLIPYFDQYFYGQGKTKALLNIGGMANVTLVGKSVSKPLAFDTGPGNSLMDRAMIRITQGQDYFDHHGRLAKKGEMDMDKITRMLEHPFFSKKPPKSTGPEMFGDAFLDTVFGYSSSLAPEKVMATLNYFTCITIQESFRSFVFPKFQVDEILVSGGGVYNKTLIKKLECLFAPIPVVSIETTGLPALAKEPLAFAFFGLRRMQNKPNHLPLCTGAKKECLLGSVTRP